MNKKPITAFIWHTYSGIFITGYQIENRTILLGKDRTRNLARDRLDFFNLCNTNYKISFIVEKNILRKD